MVGDSMRDIETAWNAKIVPVFIKNPTLPETEKPSSDILEKVFSYNTVLDWVNSEFSKKTFNAD